MKKRVLFWLPGILFLAFAGILFMDGNTVQAKRLLEKPKALLEKKVYQYDVDGDKIKEKIMVKTKVNDTKYIVTTTVYVDEKKYAVVTEKGSLCHHVYLCDLYAGKKGMNLLIYGTSDSDVIGKVQVYRLGKKKMTKIAQMKGGYKGKLSFVRMLGKIKQGSEGDILHLPGYANVSELFWMLLFKSEMQNRR